MVWGWRERLGKLAVSVRELSIYSISRWQQHFYRLQLCEPETRVMLNSIQFNLALKMFELATRGLQRHRLTSLDHNTNTRLAAFN